METYQWLLYPRSYFNPFHAAAPHGLSIIIEFINNHLCSRYDHMTFWKEQVSLAHTRSLSCFASLFLSFYLSFRSWRVILPSLDPAYERFDANVRGVSLIILLSKNRVNFHSIFTPWVVTSVITSFRVNIEWTGRDSNRWVVNFHSTGVRIEWNSLLNEWHLFTP